MYVCQDKDTLFAVYNQTLTVNYTLFNFAERVHVKSFTIIKISGQSDTLNMYCSTFLWEIF